MNDDLPPLAPVLVIFAAALLLLGALAYGVTAVLFRVYEAVR